MDRQLPDRLRRRRDAALAGHRGDAAAARALLGDSDAEVRATALAALARAGGLAVDDVAAAAADPSPAVRRRAAEVAAAAWAPPNDADPVPDPARTEVAAVVAALLHDGDASVAEVAAWACGELPPAPPATVTRLGDLASDHGDPLVREAAVAALGALGDPAGLHAILAATKDKPAVRRRAVLALAPFDGPEVDAALARAAEDRDPQVRQAADDLTRR
jgi:HEAT repeat protein